MDWTSIIGLCVAVFMVVGFPIWVFSMRNEIVRGKNRIQRAWANVITRQRYINRVIPKLLETLESFKEYESGLMSKITELRTAITKLSTDKINYEALGAVENLTKQVMAGLSATFENYPDLKASGIYQGYMREVAESESNVASAIEIYNRNIEEFNNLLKVFPSCLVNEVFNKETEIETFSDAKAEARIEFKPSFA